LAGLQLLALLQLADLVQTDSTAPYRAPAPWTAAALEAGGGPGAAVFTQHQIYPTWGDLPRYRLPTGPRWSLDRLEAQDLVAVPGMLQGLTYPLYPDIEGMSSPLYAFLAINLARMEWPERVRWMRAVGLDAAVLLEDPGVAGLSPVAETVRAGVPTFLFAVEDGAPEVWWPERAEVAEGPLAALLRVGEIDDPVAAVVIAEPVEHRAGGTVRLLTSAPDQIEVAVSGPGGVLAVRRSYQHLWRAHAGDRELRVFPLDLTLTGVEVPPGEHTVRLRVSARPEALAAIEGVAAALLCVAAGWSGRRRPAGATGAAG
jgi:hypothetical protein